MTGIYNLAPGGDSSAQLTTINTNVDGLETAIGTSADAASATGTISAKLAAIATYIDTLETALGTSGDAASPTGSISAKLASIATFVDGLEGFVDGIEGVLGTAVAAPTANTINANLVRNIKASAQCSSSANTQGSTPVAATGATASTLVNTASAGTDWRRILVYNNGTLPILIAIGTAATATTYSFPLPPGAMVIAETLASITALSTGVATTCLVTVES